MQKIKVRLPAVVTEFGASLGEVGLAIGLYVQIELIPRHDDALVVETQGLDAGYYSLGLYHPVVLGMIRVFQMLEYAPSGFTIRIDNQIPIESGLNAETVFMQAGIVAANNIMGHPLQRDDLIQFGTQMTDKPSVIATTMLGGLTVSLKRDSHVLYYALPVESQQLIIAIAIHDAYQRPKVPETFLREHTEYLLASQTLMLSALGQGNIQQFAQTITNPVYDKVMVGNISGYAHVSEVARLAGALGVTTSGRGPAMMFICEKRHDRIAEVIETAYANLDINAHVLVVSIDTQGIVLSMMTSG